MYIVLPLLDTLTSAPIHTLHTLWVHAHPHTYVDMHGRHDVYGVFVHMCVCVFVYECEVCIN